MELTSTVDRDVATDSDFAAEAPPRSIARKVPATSRAGWANVAAGGMLQSVQPIVDAVLRRVLGTNDPEYEDLVQSSLENVLVTMDGGRFRGECPPSGLAATIARNVAVDALRARSRERRVFTHDESDEIVLNEVAGQEVGPEHLVYVHQQLGEFARALSRLGDAKADVVYFHDVLGYELTEVAEMTGTSVAAAQSRLVRGRREIVDWMTADEHDGSRRPRRRHPRPENDS